MAIKNWFDGGDIRADLMMWFACIALGWLFGWWHGHRTVATECERLASFYVGDKTFDCRKVEDAPKG